MLILKLFSDRQIKNTKDIFKKYLKEYIINQKKSLTCNLINIILVKPRHYIRYAMGFLCRGFWFFFFFCSCEYFRVKNDKVSMKISWELSLSSILIALLSPVCVFFLLKIVKMCGINILGQTIVFRISCRVLKTPIWIKYFPGWIQITDSRIKDFNADSKTYRKNSLFV